MSCPGVTPVPESERLSGALAALLANVRFPLAVPAACGVKLRFRVVL